jgi:hypothetical protein
MSAHSNNPIYSPKASRVLRVLLQGPLKPWKVVGLEEASGTSLGLPVVSDIQLYLDLIEAGMRGDEAARELRNWAEFSGGWHV